MQIVTNNKFSPIKLAAGLTAGSLLLYGDLDKSSMFDTMLSDSRAQEYITAVDDLSDSSLFLRERFNILYNQWYKDTVFMSSVGSIVNHPAFNAIVSMGKDAVPYILDKIDNEPSPLVWALNLIFKSKISKDPRLTVSEACKLWVKRLNFRK